jgi:hypothetical protein
VLTSQNDKRPYTHCHTMTQISADDHVARISADDHVARISADDHVARIRADDYVARISADDHVAWISADDYVARISPDDHVARMSATAPDTLLNGSEVCQKTDTKVRGDGERRTTTIPGMAWKIEASLIDWCDLPSV